MSVRERAKAYEDSVARSTIIGDSSPPRKISREELCGSHDNSNNIERNVSEGRPTPPPRRCKKKGDCNSSPQTERKENIVEPLESRLPDTGKNHSSAQPTIIVSKGNKQGPPPRPPLPPRVSSLRRNLKYEHTATVKKPRPPVPPKPKNYFPKVVSKSDKVGSLSGTVNDVKKKSVDMSSIPSAATESASSQFFVVTKKQRKQAEQSSNLHSTKIQDEPKGPQFFYTGEEPKQVDGLSSEITMAAKEEECNGQSLRQKGEQEKERHSTNGHFYNLSTARKSTFKSYVKFTDKSYSPEETIDSLEGLDVHDVPLDYNAEGSEEERFESIGETKMNIVVDGTSECKPGDILLRGQETEEHLPFGEATTCTTDDVNVASTEMKQEENITDVKDELTVYLSCEDSSSNTSVTMDNMLESPDQGKSEQLTENSGHLKVQGEGSSFGETENISEQSRSNGSHLPVDEILAEHVISERIGNSACKETFEHPDKSFPTTSDDASEENHEKAKGNEDLEITESLVSASRGSTETIEEILEKESEDTRKHMLDMTVVTDNIDPGCENSGEQFVEEVIHDGESSELQEEPIQGNVVDNGTVHEDLCTAGSHKDFESTNHETLIEVSSEEVVKDLQLPKLAGEDGVSVVEERENGEAITTLSAKEHLEQIEATSTDDNPCLKGEGSLESQEEMSVEENEIIVVPVEDSKVHSVSDASTSELMLEHAQPVDKEIETVTCENGLEELKSSSKEETTLPNIETVSNIQKGASVENTPLEVEPSVMTQAADVDLVTEIEGEEKEHISGFDEKMELEEENKVEIKEGLDQGSGDLIREQSVDETRTVVCCLYEEKSKEEEEITASAEEKIHEVDLSETQGLGECNATEKSEEVISKQSEDERRTVVGHVREEITQAMQVMVDAAEQERDLSETWGKEECNVTGVSNSDGACRVEESLPAELENEAGLQDDKVTELPEEEGGVEPGSPVSPQPVRPERPSRQAKVQKHATEEFVHVNDQQIKGSSPVSNRKVRPSGYETVAVVLTPVTHPIPLKEDETVYKVPSTKYSVESDSVEESEDSIPPRKVSHNSEYAVPKPIFVQASQVPDNTEGSLEVYAVPGVTTRVPVVETPMQSWRNEESVYAIPKENNDVNVVLCSQKSSPTARSVSPPKPPTTSLSEEKNTAAAVAQVVVEVEVKLADPPKPLPRNRISPGAATPEVQPRRGSPSPAPRKISKISQNESENAEAGMAEEHGSPVPTPRSRVTAVDSDSRKELFQQAKEHTPTVEVKATEESPRRRHHPPPRPPPPISRVSVISSDDVPPISPGFEDNLDSDSDSDVGEVPVSKTPSKPKTYHVAHEILSTERTFVDALKLVFEECYGTIKTANVVAESVLGDIFRDLENIYMLDSRFLQELEERMQTWDEQERIGDIIKKYGHFLKMYTTYVKSYDKAMGVFQETMKENPEFANLVAEFQASERCHGMQLSAYMLKPVQRIPSYRLLLIDYLKHLPKDSEECKDTEATLKIVSEVATHINESMKKMDSFEQLLKIQRMLVGHPEIVKAGRDFHKEGTLMKLCRKDMQERRFFLLTDVLLYTTPVGINQYKLNKTLPLLGMQVTVPDSPDFVNEFSIISTTRSFTLTASTPEERDEWIEDLNKAIEVVTKRKITFVSKTKDVSALPEQSEDVKLGEKAPVWIPDARVTMCMNCTSPFTLTNRRHHCRACGKVVCGACSDCTAPLAYLDFVQARVCDKCYDLLLKEFHTDEINIDTEADPLPPLLQESEEAEKYLKKPTKFEMMRRFKSRKTKKRKSQLMHPSHLTEVVGNEVGSQMSGYLKCKKGRSGWKKSWFVLKDRVLYAYKASSDVVALESVPVLGYDVDDLGKDEDDFLFNLSHKGIAPLAFKADHETSATRWIQELKKAVKLEDL